MGGLKKCKILPFMLMDKIITLTWYTIQKPKQKNWNF
jgi:hypothetical protein